MSRSFRVTFLHLPVVLLCCLIALSCAEYTMLAVESDQAETVFAGSGDRKFLALDAQTGLKKWEFTTDEVVTVTPTVNNGIIYTGSDHTFYALDATTGAKKWEFSTGPRPSSHYVPAANNGYVYVLGDNRTKLYALDATTGAKKWSVTSASFAMDGGWYSDPLVVNGVLYVGGTDSILYAVDTQSGLKKWNFKAGSGFYTRPTLVDGIIYAGCYDGNLYALDATTGTKKWAASLGGYVQSPRVGNGVIYVTNWNGLFALDIKTGTQRWHFVPTINDGYTGNTDLIAIDNGAIYGGFVPLDWNDGFVYALDAALGTQKRELWPWPGGLAANVSRAIVTNGSIYIGGKDNTLRAMDMLTKDTKWSFKTGGYIAYSLCILTKQGKVISAY